MPSADDYIRNAGGKRNEWKPQPKYTPSHQQVKNYKRFLAAQQNNQTFGWTTQAQHIDQVIRQKLRTLRARSREQAQNNDYLKKFINLAKANIIGPDGITVRSRVMRKNKLPEELDEPANKAIDKAFQDWRQNSILCSVNGDLTFLDIENLFISSMIHDGEFIAIEYIGHGEHGYQLMVLDPEQLDVEYNDRKGGNIIRMGIEYDAMGKKVAYHFNGIDEYGHYSRANGFRVNADIVIHEYLREWPGQSRGIPWVSTALFRMKMLDGYEDAAITAARAGANKLGFIKMPQGQNFVGDEEDEDGNIILNEEAGSWTELPNGTEIDSYDPKYPHEQYNDFVKRTLRGIGSGLLGSYESIANDREGVNYSSLRHGELEQRDIWKMGQSFAIQRLTKRCRENWLKYVLLTGKVFIQMNSGKQIPLNRSFEDYKPCMYQGRRWDWVDPQKEMSANQIAVNLGVCTVSDIIRNKGGDPEEVFKERSAEITRMKELNIYQEPAPAAGFVVIEDEEDETKTKS